MTEREPLWLRLDELVRSAKRRPARLAPAQLRELGHTYRAASADLAYARRAWPGDPLVGRLETTVRNAHALVYDASRRRFSIREFYTRGYWQRVRERPRLLILSWTLLLAPMVAMTLYGAHEPAPVESIVGITRDRLAPEGDRRLKTDEKAAFSSIIFTNNIRVSFLALAGGLTAGIGTVLLMLWNGVLAGGVIGLSINVDSQDTMIELLAPHGFLELSIIVVSAAAGLRIGWAMIDPGRATRRQAIGREGRIAGEIVVGTVPWFVVAGLIEGFITPTGLGWVTAMLFGLAIAAIYWTLLVSLGRRPAVSPIDRW